MRVLLPVVGWKRVRHLQTLVYRSGWQAILRRKAKKRLMDTAR
jgi:hypothetical protein